MIKNIVSVCFQRVGGCTWFCEKKTGDSLRASGQILEEESELG